MHTNNSTLLAHEDIITKSWFFTDESTDHWCGMIRSLCQTQCISWQIPHSSHNSDTMTFDWCVTMSLNHIHSSYWDVYYAGTIISSINILHSASLNFCQPFTSLIISPSVSSHQQASQDNRHCKRQQCNMQNKTKQQQQSSVSFLYCTCVHFAVGREEPEISINLSKGCRETDQPNNLESAHTTSAAKARAAAAASHNHILLSHRLPIHHTSNSSTITTTITSCRSIYHHRNAYTSHNIYKIYIFPTNLAIFSHICITIIPLV